MLLTIGIEIEESLSELKLDPQDTSPNNIQGDGAAKKESLRANGSKMHHGSKGKQQRDRRKLREKRRSTGIVNLASTGSTGGSTTAEEELQEDMGTETKKNTQQNENIGNNA